MAASGYMTEADVEGIWDTEWDTARFNLINVRIAEMLNFLVNGDATSQVTNTAVVPILEQISEEVLLDLRQAARTTGTTNNPWEYITANISKVDWRFYDGYMLKKVREKLDPTSTIEVVTRRLPRTTDSGTIP